MSRRAAGWLARQVNQQGFIPASPGGSQANLSATAQTVLALGTARAYLGVARLALRYMEANAPAYTDVDGAEGPGQLAILILGAATLGVNPRQFGGANLVGQLLATQQIRGTDQGLFGTEAQVADDAAGTYDQGLALAALDGAGVRGNAVIAAARWLAGEQCTDGGWTLPDKAVNGCGGDATSGGGPDTNSTALAVEGLAAQGELSPPIAARARAFIEATQRDDAGWPYASNDAYGQAFTDPDSTALVIQALVASHTSFSEQRLRRGTATPMSALLSFQIKSGSASGAFYYPPASASGNVIATYQAIPALLGEALPPVGVRP